MADPFEPPPGARGWLASCFMYWMQRESHLPKPYDATPTDRAYGLIGALQERAQLTPEQEGQLNHWLWPTMYDEQGRRLDDRQTTDDQEAP
jgi:hypothetical protein